MDKGYPHSDGVATLTPDQEIVTLIREDEREIVRAIVEALWDASFGRDWPCRQGLTDWSSYKTLLREAYHNGRLISAGVRVSLSVRQWAEQAGVSKSTIKSDKGTPGVEKRLMLDHKLITRDGRGEGEESGAFVLLVSPLGVRRTGTPLQRWLNIKRMKENRARKESFVVSDTAYERTGSAQVSSKSGPSNISPQTEFLSWDAASKSFVVSNTVHRCTGLARVSFRWSAAGQRCLGKTKEALLDALVLLGNSATDRELAEKIGRKNNVRGMRKHLNELVEEESILKRSGQQYYFHTNTGVELVTTRVTNGEAERDELQKENHIREREVYRQLRRSEELPSKAKEKKRRKTNTKIKRDASAIKREQREARRKELRREAVIQAAVADLDFDEPDNEHLIEDLEPLPPEPEPQPLPPVQPMHASQAATKATSATPVDKKTLAKPPREVPTETLSPELLPEPGLFSSEEFRTWKDPDDDAR